MFLTSRKIIPLSLFSLFFYIVIFHLLLQKSAVPNVEELITMLSCDKKQQAPVKIAASKPQLSNVVPSETFCSTSVTPRQRPKPMNTTIATAALGSSPVLKRALFPNPSSIQQASQSPDVTCSFANPPSTNSDSTDTRFQPTDHTQKPFSVTPPPEAASFDNLFPSNTGNANCTLVFVFHGCRNVSAYFIRASKLEG